MKEQQKKLGLSLDDRTVKQNMNVKTLFFAENLKIQRLCDKKMEQVHLLDIELAKLIRSYPKVTDESFVELIRMYYVMYNRNPTLTDFDTVSREDVSPESHVFGPMTVFGTKRPSTQGIAISNFILSVLKLPLENPLFPKHEPNAVRHIHFIKWNLYQPDQLREMRREFYRRQKEVALSNFIFVGKRFKEDLVVCTHTLTVDPNVPLEVRRENEVRKHIENCLGKTEEKNGPDQKVVTRNERWREIPKDFERSQIDRKVWEEEHPYFSECDYEPNGLIVLRPEQKKKLKPDHQRMCMMMESGEIQQADIVEFAEFLRAKLSRLYQLYLNFGYDVLEFALSSHLTLPELLKLYVDPPVPRAPPTRTLPFAYAPHQHSAFILIPLMQLLTNKKTGKGKVTILAIDRTNPEIAAFLLRFNMVSWKVATDINWVFIDDEKIIGDFLVELCELLFFPFESILPNNHEPVLCDKNHPLFQTMSTQGSLLNGVTLGGSTMAAPKRVARKGG